MALGVVDSHIGIVGFVVRASKKADEQRLIFFRVSDPERVVCPFTVVYGENCSTSGEEPFVFDVVHCANTLNKSLAKVKPLLDFSVTTLYQGEFM